MLQRCCLTGLAVAATLAFTTATARAELRYRLQELANYGAVANAGPPGPVDYFVPSAINNHGVVVGLRQQEVYDEIKDYIETAYIYGGTRLEPLPGSDAFHESHAAGINDRGQIIGGFRMRHTPGQTPFLYANGHYRDLRVEGTEIENRTTGINASGQVVGDANGRAFFFDGTRSRYMDIPGALGSNAEALNDHGAVVGNAYFNAPGGGYDFRAFVHDGQNVKFLPNPLRDFGTPEMVDINNAGQMVANVVNGERRVRRSLIYEADGRFTDLGNFSARWEETVVESLNDRGWAVGHSRGDTCFDFSCNQAFLWRNGRMVSLNDLVLVSPDEQWHLSRATDINERGQIVGSGWHGGSFSAYLLTPVPEPRSWALLLAGLGLVGAVARRRPARGR